MVAHPNRLHMKRRKRAIVPGPTGANEGRTIGCRSLGIEPPAVTVEVRQCGRILDALVAQPARHHAARDLGGEALELQTLGGLDAEIRGNQP
jgi:hypothetical protein